MQAITVYAKHQGDRRYRDQQRLFFIEGVRNFVESVDHGFSIETLVYSEKLPQPFSAWNST
jgi:RNA methyltransferase, TrmH family